MSQVQDLPCASQTLLQLRRRLEAMARKRGGFLPETWVDIYAYLQMLSSYGGNLPLTLQDCAGFALLAEVYQDENSRVSQLRCKMFSLLGEGAGKTAVDRSMDRLIQLFQQVAETVPSSTEAQKVLREIFELKSRRA